MNLPKITNCFWEWVILVLALREIKNIPNLNVHLTRQHNKSIWLLVLANHTNRRCQHNGMPPQACSAFASTSTSTTTPGTLRQYSPQSAALTPATDNAKRVRFLLDMPHLFLLALVLVVNASTVSNMCNNRHKKCYLVVLPAATSCSNKYLPACLWCCAPR
jgi:hypothetical protein